MNTQNLKKQTYSSSASQNRSSSPRSTAGRRSYGNSSDRPRSSYNGPSSGGPRYGDGPSSGGSRYSDGPSRSGSEIQSDGPSSSGGSRYSGGSTRYGDGPRSSEGQSSSSFRSSNDSNSSGGSRYGNSNSGGYRSSYSSGGSGSSGSSRFGSSGSSGGSRFSSGGGSYSSGGSRYSSGGSGSSSGGTRSPRRFDTGDRPAYNTADRPSYSNTGDRPSYNKKGRDDRSFNKAPRDKKYNRTTVQRLIMNLLVSQNDPSTNSYKAWELADIMQHLSIDVAHQTVVQEELEMLVKMKYIRPRGFQTFAIDRDINLNGSIIEGRFSLTTRGFGFVAPNKMYKETYSSEIFINKMFVNGALTDDSVTVQIIKHTPKGYEGIILSITEAYTNNIVCNVLSIKSDSEFIAFHHLFPRHSIVLATTDECPSIAISDRVFARIVRDTSISLTADIEAADVIKAEAISVLGSILDASLDNKAVVLENSIVVDFPTMVTKEAEGFSSEDIKEEEDRKDIRHLTTITIDPKTSKDFDDAISLIKNDDLSYDLYVHIADVTHYVSKNGHLDLEAKRRSNSVYLPGECIPMLPNQLSDNLCSLLPQKDRYALTVHLSITKEGVVSSSDIFPSLIHSDFRFSYETAMATINKTENKSENISDAVFNMLHDMHTLALKMAINRRENGFLEFSLDEISVVVNEKGVPEHIDRVPYDMSHRMIEIFMVSANKAAADFVTEKIGKNKGIFRVHENPTSEKEGNFVKLMQSFGINIGFPVKKSEMQSILDHHKGTPLGDLITVSYIQHMQQAVYSNTNNGHYGLSVSSYCHFTSPIRRYSDLIMHRIIKQYKNNKSEAMEIETLQDIAEHCSLLERKASWAESCCTKMKKLRYLYQQYKDNSHAKFQCLVTNVFPFFITIQIPALAMDGKIHVSNLPGFFEVSSDTHEMRDKKNNKTIKIGDVLNGSLAEVDLKKMHVEWKIETLNR